MIVWVIVSELILGQLNKKIGNYELHNIDKFNIEILYLIIRLLIGNFLIKLKYLSKFKKFNTLVNINMDRTLLSSL